MPRIQTKMCTLPMLSLLCALLFSLTLAQTKFPVGKYASGDFTVAFGDDGKHIVTMNGSVIAKGTYIVTEDQITITDKEGEMICPSPGKYKWKLDGTSLKFEKVEDDCEGRVGALHGATWAKK